MSIYSYILSSLVTINSLPSLKINFKKTEKMLRSKQANFSTIDNFKGLFANESTTNTFDGFKYIESYVGSKEHYVQVSIGLAWADIFARTSTETCWVSNNRGTIWKKKDLISELTKYQFEKWSASASSISKVIVFVCIPMNPSIALSNMNLKWDHIFNEERQQGHIESNYWLNFYTTRKRSKPKK